MKFDLIGFDFFLKNRLFGIWLCVFNTYNNFHRSLFCIYFNDGEWIFELFWYRYKNPGRCIYLFLGLALFIIGGWIAYAYIFPEVFNVVTDFVIKAVLITMMTP